MKRAFVIPGLSTDSELHHWSLCGNVNGLVYEERSMIKMFSLVLHMCFHCGETWLGLLVCDFVFGYIRD